MFRFDLGQGAFLAPLEARHAEPLFQLVDANRPHLRPWMAWVDETRKVSDTEAFIQKIRAQDAAQGTFVAGIWVGGTPAGGTVPRRPMQLAGVVGHNAIDWVNRIAILGYWLGQEFQGRGLMTRACRAIVHHDFNEFNLNRVEIRVATANTRSAAVPTRLGFEREGVLRDAEWLYDHYVDHTLFACLARHWAPNREIILPALPGKSQR